jgi:hypothetical protein
MRFRLRRGASAAKTFFEKLGVNHLRAFADPQLRFTRALGIRGLPTTFVLDADGKILGRLEGPAAWDTDDFITPLQKLAH